MSKIIYPLLLLPFGFTFFFKNRLLEIKKKINHILKHFEIRGKENK